MFAGGTIVAVVLVVLSYSLGTCSGYADRLLSAAEREPILSAIAPLGRANHDTECDPNNRPLEIDDANCDDERSWFSS